MPTLETFITYRTKDLTLFLGEFTFFSLSKLLDLITSLFSKKLEAKFSAIRGIRNELESVKKDSNAA